MLSLHWPKLPALITPRQAVQTMSHGYRSVSEHIHASLVLTPSLRREKVHQALNWKSEHQARTMLLGLIAFIKPVSLFFLVISLCVKIWPTLWWKENDLWSLKQTRFLVTFTPIAASRIQRMQRNDLISTNRDLIDSHLKRVWAHVLTGGQKTCTTTGSEAEACTLAALSCTQAS